MRTIVFLCLLCVLTVSGAVAQVTPVTADSLRSRYAATGVTILRLERSLPGLAAEDSSVVLNEIEVALIDAATTLDELATALAVEARSGGAVADSSTVREYLDFEGRLWEADAYVSDRLHATRAVVDDAEGKERGRLERDLALEERRLDTVHRLLQKHLLAMGRLGVDTRQDRQHLSAHLVTRADLLTGRIRLVEARLQWMKDRARRFRDDADLKSEIDLATTRARLYAESLRDAATRLRALGQDATAYEHFLAGHTKEFSRGALSLAVARGLIDDWWIAVRGWVGQNGFGVTMKTALFVFILFLAWILARVAKRALERAFHRPRVRISQLLQKMLVGLIGNLVLAAGFLVALSQTGFDLGPVLAGVGVVGFIVGFALQDTLANFAAGVMILFFRPYDLEDTVEVGGVFGKVSHMSLVSTTILTFDNETLVVPNGKIWGDVIRNVTAQRVRRVDLVFGISYRDDIPKAERILLSILESNARVLKEPAPIVKLYKLNESSVDFIVRPWVQTEDYWDAFWEVTREVKLRFDAEGISIPFPQRDVHHYVNGAPSLPVRGPGRPEPAPGRTSHGGEVEDGQTPES